MPVKKLRYWILAVLLVVIVTFLAYLASKAVMVSQIITGCRQLYARFEEDPAWPALKLISQSEKYSIDLELNGGEKQWNLSILTDRLCHQLFSEGTVSMDESDWDFTAYLDDRVMAVSSQKLLQGNCYGITYDTFLADLEKIPFLGLFSDSDVFLRCEEGLKQIQERMGRDCAVLPIPDLPELDVKQLALGLLLAPHQWERRCIDSANCCVMSYPISGALLSTWIPGWEGARDSWGSISFYLKEGSLILIRANCHSPIGNADFVIQMEESWGKGSLCFAASIEDRYARLEISPREEKGRGWVSENWRIHYGGQMWEMEYTRNTTDGKMNLSACNTALRLHMAEKTLYIESGDFSELISWVTDRRPETPVDGTIAVRCGTEISKPSYKKFNQMSWEDYAILIEAIGKLANMSP